MHGQQNGKKNHKCLSQRYTEEIKTNAKNSFPLKRISEIIP